MNGPEIGEADNTLKDALDRHFDVRPWHFLVNRNIFKTPGETVNDILNKKSKLPFYN